MAYLDSAHQQLPFISGSDTSRDAALAIAPSATTQRARYAQWLASRGDFGGTDKEAALQLEMGRATLCPRRRELEKDGLVVKTVRRRGGCAVYTWAVR